MIKMKKAAALIMAGTLACSVPMPVMASGNTDVVESLLDSGIDFLASDPQKAIDIILYARKFDSLFSSNTSQSLYWLYFFVKIKFYLYTLHYVVV